MLRNDGSKYVLLKVKQRCAVIAPGICDKFGFKLVPVDQKVLECCVVFRDMMCSCI